MEQFARFVSILVVTSLAYSDRVLGLTQREFTPDYLDGPYYNDLHCTDVPGCYCSLSGEDYQAECMDPMLSWIPPRLSYNITRLHVIGTALTTVTADDLKPYVYLRVIQLSDNANLTTIQEGSLNDLLDLEEFIIVENEVLEHIAPNIVQQNMYLTHFDGRNNKLNELPSFGGLRNLEHVLLSGNLIHTIISTQFMDCVNLKTIDLSRNKLSKVPKNAFNQSSLLQELDLSVNEITVLDRDAFNSLTTVENIVLRSNQLTTVTNNLFLDCGALRTLDLSENKITAIEDQAFAGLASLEYLWLSVNSLTTIPTIAIDQISAMYALHLGGNKFSEIPASALSGQVGLKELFLDDMVTLSNIQIGAFRGLAALLKLSLADNPNLLELRSEQLPAGDLPVIEYLYLNGDGFVYLDEALFNDKTNLALVDLYDNKFNCSCNLKWMPRAVAEEAWASHWITSGTPPRCYTPHHLNGVSIPTMLEDDMTCDELKMIRIGPEEQTTHLTGSANFTVHLRTGLPESNWTTPDNELLVPYPVGDHPLNLRRYASVSLLEDNVIESMLIIHNASQADQGVYTVKAGNIAGTKEMTFKLEVLPYELTTTPVVWETTQIVVDAATMRMYSSTLIVMASLIVLFQNRVLWC